MIEFSFPSIHKKARTFLCLGIFMIIAIAAGIVFFKTGSEAANTPEIAPAMTVSAAHPKTQTWAETIHATGPLVAWQEASIGTELSGQRLTELLANVGDHVKKGQVLARYNTETLLAEYAQLKASYSQAEADRLRTVPLKGTRVMSDQQILQYETTARIAKAQLDAKDIQLRNADIIAPDDGTISARSATLGSVSGNGQELFRLICQDKLEWRGQLTPAQLAGVAQGQKVALQLPNGSTAEAVIRNISPSLDESTRMAIVYADLTPTATAYAGMYAAGAIEVSKKAALTVPALSIVIRDGRSYVFKLGKPEGITKAIMQEVVVGRNQGTESEILKGIVLTDTIAVQGAGFLNDEDTVLVGGMYAAVVESVKKEPVE